MTWLTNPGFVLGICIGVWSAIIGSLPKLWMRVVGFYSSILVLPLLFGADIVNILSTYPNRGLLLPGGFFGMIFSGLIYWIFVRIKSRRNSTSKI